MSDLSRSSNLQTYGPEYYAETHRNWFEHPNLALFETIHRTIFAAAPAAAILDVGCGKGDLLRYLQKRNSQYSLCGLDLSENAALPGITILRGDILTYPLERSFDAVVSLAAIEHLQDVHGFIRRLRQLCAPSGQVLIMTLNERSVLYAVARALHRLGWRGPLVRLHDKHHVNHFNVRSLRSLVTSSGLVIERTLKWLT